MSNIAQYASDIQPNITLLSETWQTSSLAGKYDSFSAAIKDFAAAEGSSINCISCPRPTGGRGVGVATLCKTDLNVKRFSFRNDYTTFESLFVIVKHNIHTILLGNIYRIPSANIPFQDFIDEFRDLLMFLAHDHRPVVLAGDFNTKMNLPENLDTSSFTTLITEFDLSSLLPDVATHEAGNILDFAVVSSSLLPHFSSISVDSSITVSDHFPLLLSLVFDSSPSSKHPVCFRNRRFFNNLDHDLFSSTLSQSLTSLDPPSNLKDYVHKFNSTLTETLDRFAPLKKVVTKKNENPPWLDQEYIKARALRRRYEKQNNKPAYNRQRKLCENLANQKKKAYYSSLFSELERSNQQQLFKTFNKLFDQKKNKLALPTNETPVSLANSFNKFFLNKVSDIRSNLPVAKNTDSYPDAESSFFSPSPSSEPPSTSSTTNNFQLSSFDPSTVDELRLIIKKHGIKTSSNDPLPAFLVDENLELLLPHLNNLVNLSLSTSSFDGLKDAHVIPILKSLQLDSEDFKSYRPVSLLSFVSKLTERVVHKRITDYLSANNLNVPSQYGYKRHHSCESFLLKMIDDILVAVDRKLGVVVLIIDLSAAFDTVDHKLLLNILQYKFHITGTALSWLNSFLSDRTQCVKIGDCLSSSLSILFGVPQGSILGPLLFNLYCASLPDAFSSAGFDSMGYADDNLGFRIFPAFSKLSTLFSSVPSCLTSISDWTSSHFLKLNETKTHIMVFGNKNFKQSLNLSGCLDSTGALMPLCHSTKLLGAHIDDSLSFNLHVSKTVSSSLMILKNVRSIRKYLTPESAATLIHSIITSKLDQCNSLLLGMSASNLNKLQLIQNFALRTVLNLRPRSRNLSQHFQDLHWLTIEQRIHFKILTTTFKCIHCLAPSPLSAKVFLSCPLDMTLDSSRFYPSSTFGKRAFSYSAPRCWNALPRSLRVIPCLDTFKSHLKHFLFTDFPSYLHSINPYT